MLYTLRSRMRKERRKGSSSRIGRVAGSWVGLGRKRKTKDEKRDFEEGAEDEGGEKL